MLMPFIMVLPCAVYEEELSSCIGTGDGLDSYFPCPISLLVVFYFQPSVGHQNVL